MHGVLNLSGSVQWDDGSVTEIRVFGSTTYELTPQALRSLMSELENYSTTEVSPLPAAPTDEQQPK